ncbi:MAG: hypothetical protein MMC33_006947 [Icmadophila ericetorum]|nr:hypothetical protein [Icmadophila ericetorum]
MNMLSGKVYVVTSPDLVAAVNRNSKALAFNPFIAQVGKRITGHDEATSQIVQHNLNGENGLGYVIDVHDGIVAALLPGKYLEEMVEPMLRQATVYLEALGRSSELNLFVWMREMVTVCSMRAIYGPEDPFKKNPTYYNDLFWDFDRNLNLMIINIAPSIIAPKGNKARSILAKAFEQYFTDYVPGVIQSSAMIRARYASNTKWGLTVWNQGRLEVGTLLGVLANTIPSSFYMLVHVYADRELLEQLRAEIEANCVLATASKMKRTLNITNVRERCHLLHSACQEMLRMHAQGAGSRFVREDTMLDNRYLLKKGMVIQMPMAVMHSDASVWGSDVKDFKPQRFMKQNDIDAKKSGGGSFEEGHKSKQNTAYRPFGGGSSMCPGRHFVTLEIMALTAYIILQFDMAPTKGEWKIPPQKQESLATNVFPPEKDVQVKVTRRKGYEDVDWDFVVR